MAFFQAKHLWIKHLADGVAALVLDRHNSPFNFLDPAMLDDLARALDALTKEGHYRLLVIRSGKAGSFCQGPGASVMGTWKNADFAAWAEQGQKVCATLQEMPIPSVAVIAGSCLDAGLELALACDYRVVVKKPSTSLGFSQLEWGMIPCWGSTERLPRLIGLQHSLPLLIGSTRLGAHIAWMHGLADDVSEEPGDSPPAFLVNPVKRDWSSFPRRSWRERYLESNRPGRWLLFHGAERILRTTLPAELPASAEMLEALRVVYRHTTMQAGFDFERQALGRIVAHPALHHLLRLLSQRDELRSSPTAFSVKQRIHHVGILGTGVLGLSLLLHGAGNGYEMVLRPKDKESLGVALAQIDQLLRTEILRGTMTEGQCQKILAAIRGTYTWTHFDKLDLIVDATEGSLAEKQAFYRELEQQVPASALLAAAPNLYRLGELQAGLQRPERLVGLRIIEPWNRGSLAEIIVPSTVSGSAVQTVRDWAISLGKSCLDIPDRPGGLAMRVWLPALNEAGLMIREGVAIQEIDAAMRHFGMTISPMEWMDRLGLDYVAARVNECQPLFSGRILFESGFRLMEEKGWLGNRSDFGFYGHNSGRATPHRGTEALWRREGAGEAARPVPTLSRADLDLWIQKRMVTLMILEAARCLAEGIVADANDLDCALCLTGWATHRGGPIGYARQLGYEAVASLCAELVREHGVRFAAPAGLEDLFASSS